MEKLKYSKNFDSLVALLTHLSLTNSGSRTPSNLARDLRLGEQDVKDVLKSFPAFFRESRKASSDGEKFYTVHLRYARRREGSKSEPVESDELASLLGVIANLVAQEQETARLNEAQKQETARLDEAQRQESARLDQILSQQLDSMAKANNTTRMAAITAAVSALLSAVIAAIAAIVSSGGS